MTFGLCLPDILLCEFACSLAGECFLIAFCHHFLVLLSHGSMNLFVRVYTAVFQGTLTNSGHSSNLLASCVSQMFERL
jgi:hypothetical protein